MDGEIPPTTDDQTDWEQVARNALVNGAAKGMRKVNRRNLTDLCTNLAAGIPLETAARLQGIQPQAIRAWSETRPTAWRAIEQARSVGERRCLERIAAAADWKAQDRLLTLINENYRDVDAAARGAGGIQVVINVAPPRQLTDITPQAVDSVTVLSSPETAK